MTSLRIARRSVLTCAALALPLLCGCGATQSQAGALRDSVTEFAQSMRWGRVDVAASHVPDATRAAFIRQKRAAWQQIQVHEYEIRAVEHVAGTGRARVVIHAAWSRAADPITHLELLEQDWRWEKDHWVMAGQRPVAAAAAAVEPGDAL